MARANKYLSHAVADIRMMHKRKLARAVFLEKSIPRPLKPEDQYRGWIPKLKTLSSINFFGGIDAQVLE